MLTDTLSVGQYLLSQCQGYIKYPPNNPFSLGRMSYILELTNMMGYGSSETFCEAQKVFATLAPKIASKGKKRK